MCLLAFSGFLRYDELRSIKRCDVKLFDYHLTIFIEKCKTDQFRQGNTVFIAKTFSELCPHERLKLYLLRIGLFSPMDSELFVFRALTPNGSALRANNVPLSYTRAREIFLDKLESVGLNKSLYGRYSRSQCRST